MPPLRLRNERKKPRLNRINVCRANNAKICALLEIDFSLTLILSVKTVELNFNSNDRNSSPGAVPCCDGGACVRALTTPKAMSAGAYASGRFNHVESVYGRGARLNSALALQVGG